MDARQILFDVVYIPVMLRYGSTESHHYMLGIWRDKDKAIKMAKEEKLYRGGKYEYVIYACCINKAFEESYDILKEQKIASSDDSIMIDSNKHQILNDVETFKKYYDRQQRKRLYERKYQLERDLKQVKRQLNERKRLQEEE